MKNVPHLFLWALTIAVLGSIVFAIIYFGRQASWQ